MIRVKMQRWLWLWFVLFILPVQAVLGGVNKTQNTKVITIGLLISNKTQREAKRAAELAIREANIDSALKGIAYRLVTRSMEGPWGTGAKQTVDLVFNEKAWAIIGSHDGRNAHLAEQVTAKTQIPYVSAWAGDPTLSQAYVPWYVGVAPNSIQEAKVLSNEIYNRQNFKKVIVLSDDDYDSKISLKYFLAELDESQQQQLVQIEYKKTKPDLNKIMAKVEAENADAVVLLGGPDVSIKILELLRNKMISVKVFASLSLLGESTTNLFVLSNYENIFIINPEYLSNKKGKLFTNNFEKEYGITPSATAAYAYDSINLVIKAIEDSKFDTNTLKQTIREIEFCGITGNISFDNLGNRSVTPTMIKIENRIAREVDD